MALPSITSNTGATSCFASSAVLPISFTGELPSNSPIIPSIMERSASAEARVKISRLTASDRGVMAWVNKIRTRFEPLDPAAPIFQSRQNRQCHRRLADTTLGAGNDQSWRNHTILLLRIVIDSQPNKDRSHRGTEQ